jgi:hypothetical protein
VAVGYPPFDFCEYHRQLGRWATGTFQNYRYALALLISRRGVLTRSQWLWYLGWNGTFYLQCLSTLFFALAGIVFLFFDLYRYCWYTDGIALVGSLVTVLGIGGAERGVKSLSLSRLLLLNIIFFGDCVVVLCALRDVLLGRRAVFAVTGKQDNKRGRVAPTYIWFNVAMALSLAIAIGVALVTMDGVIVGTIWPFLFWLQSTVVVIVLVAHGWTKAEGGQPRGSAATDGKGVS